MVRVAIGITVACSVVVVVVVVVNAVFVSSISVLVATSSSIISSSSSYSMRGGVGGVAIIIIIIVCRLQFSHAHLLAPCALVEHSAHHPFLRRLLIHHLNFNNSIFYQLNTN